MATSHSWNLTKHYTKQAALGIAPAALAGYIALTPAAKTLDKILNYAFTPEIPYTEFVKNYPFTDKIVVSGNTLNGVATNKYGYPVPFRTRLPDDFNHENLLTSKSVEVTYKSPFDPLNYSNELLLLFLSWFTGNRFSAVLNTRRPQRPEKTEKPQKSGWHVAIHEAGHVLLAYNAEKNGITRLKSANILKTDQTYGTVEDEIVPKNITRHEIVSYIALNMAGRAAERIIFGDNSINTGASIDIKNASLLASYAVKKAGLSDLGPIYCGSEFIKDNPIIEDKIFEEMRKLINEAEAFAVSYLRDNREALLAVADALMEHGELEHDELIEIIENSHQQLSLDFETVPSYTPEV